MKKVSIYIIALFLVGPAFSADPIFQFEVGDIHLSKAIFKSDKIADRTSIKLSNILTSSFSEDSYEFYQTLFAPGECHVDLDTYWNWKTSFGQYAPIVEAVFYITKENTEYAIIQYTMAYEGKKYLLPQAFKKIGNQWYFLGKEENVDMLHVNVFFSLTSESLIEDLEKENLLKDFPDAVFLTTKNKINGQYLVDHLLDRYQPQNEHSDFMNQYLLQPIQSTEKRKVGELENIQNYFNSASLSQADFDHVMNLFTAHQIIPALTKFADLTKRDVMEVYVEIKELQNL